MFRSIEMLLLLLWKNRGDQFISRDGGGGWWKIGPFYRMHDTVVLMCVRQQWKQQNLKENS